MRICVCATGPDLDSQISPIFGRCGYFLIVDSENKKFKAVLNSAVQAARGAGVAASQIVVSEGTEAVICGNFGPSSFSVLQMSGIKIYSGVTNLTVREVIDKYNEGELKEMEMPTAPGHFGFGPSGGGRGGGFGPGPGWGKGRGRGRRRMGR